LIAGKSTNGQWALQEDDAMGGLGSGREPSCRPKLDNMASIDVRRLRREGCLTPGYHGIVPLQAEGREVGAVTVRRDGDVLVLKYGLPGPHGRMWVEDQTALQHTSQPGGGERVWLSCPACGCRCGVLFGSPRFRCRTCTGAHYVSQTESVGGRLHGRARAIRVKLGGDTLFGPFPPKPKRMKWRTYIRLFEDYKRTLADAERETRRTLASLWRRVQALAPAEDRLPDL
jgi:hypothetical protein